MKYVNMNEVAYDANGIVFPGLGHCHGVVYQTNVGLFALHIYGGPQDTTHKAPLFGDFVKRHARGATAQGVCLFGAAPTIRFQGLGGSAAQKTELRQCAAALGFTGPIEGGMWDLTQLGWNTTYAAFNLSAGGAVQVRIENFTGQNPVLTPNQSYFDQREVAVQRVPFQNTMMWSSLKPSNSVVNSVIRKPGTPGFILHTAVL